MSTTIAEYEAREARAIELIPQVEEALNRVRYDASEAVKLGYELGDNLEHLIKRHKDNAGTWLLSICPNVDVSRFALRASRVCRSKGLDDPNQLFLALMLPEQGDTQLEKPKRGHETETMALTGYSQKIRLLLAKWGEDKVSEWPRHRRDAFVRAVSPLAELLARVQEVNSRE